MMLYHSGWPSFELVVVGSADGVCKCAISVRPFFVNNEAYVDMLSMSSIVDTSVVVAVLDVDSIFSFVKKTRGDQKK